MNLHLEKGMRIINDLIAFCHVQGGEEFRVFLTHSEKDKVTAMTVESPIPGLEQDVIDGFSKKLNLARQHEIEQNYWELSGESEMSGELTLVGMMIDEAKVGYVDGILYIHAWRYD